MKFDYEVKHNGKIYPAGTDVPVGNPVQEEPVKKAEAEVEKPKPKAYPKKNRTTKK